MENHNRDDLDGNDGEEEENEEELKKKGIHSGDTIIIEHLEFTHYEDAEWWGKKPE